MEELLPFRHEDEKTLLNDIHPLIRLIFPFIFIIPILFKNDIYLIYTLILIVLIIGLISRLNLMRIFTRLKNIIPFIFLITIFIPFYFGSTIIFEINIGIKIKIFEEGLTLSFLLFSRIFGATFIFMFFYSSLTYSEFIEALSKLRLPAYFVGSLMIMLHYIPIFATSNKKILESQELRGRKVTSYWKRLKAHAYIMGKNIVMNMERSEKLYESLKMRGFAGKLSFITRKVKVLDFLILIIFISLVIFLAQFINLEQIYLGAVSLFL